MADECTRLLGRLDTQELRDIAVWKMEGFTSEEIAARLGCARLTIERRLRLIRQIWEEETAASAPLPGHEADLPTAPLSVLIRTMSATFSRTLRKLDADRPRRRPGSPR